MNDEEFESLLVYALDERHAAEDAWHELCTGGKTREQVVELRAGVETEQALSTKLELFAPMSNEVREAMLANLLERYYPQGHTHDPDGSPGDDDALADAPGSADPRAGSGTTPKTHERGSRWWGVAALAGMMALAAAILLVWMRPRSTPSSDPLPLMPAMELVLHGDDPWGVRSAGGPTESPDRCKTWARADEPLAVTLRPREVLHDDLAVAVWAQRDGRAHGWLSVSHLRQRSDDTLTLEVQLGPQRLDVGMWTLTFYVTRKGQQLEEAAIIGLEPGGHPGVAVAEGTVCVEEPRP